MKKPTRIFWAALCVTGYFVCFVLITVFNRASYGANAHRVIPVIENTAMCGIFNMVEIVFCLILVLLELKHSVMLAALLCVLEVVFPLNAIFMEHFYSSIPGLINGVVGTFIVLLVGSQLAQLNTEANTDYLTQIPNRRFVVDKLQSFVKNAGGGFLFTIYRLRRF